MEESTPVSQRRLWVQLKYYNGKPVLIDLHVISKPSQRIFATVEKLRNTISGRDRRGWKYASQLGAVTLVSTRAGIQTAPNAIASNLGGEVMLLAR